jgi:uncharacterized Ntn-hydrolase superfamily protein
MADMPPSSRPVLGAAFPRTRPPRSGTYSIVARDPATGALGVATQSHWFSVGSLVLAGRAGVGVIAAQANPDLHHRSAALALLRDGRPADQVLAALLEHDPGARHRQTGVVDARGGVAGYTGESCIEAAGHIVGADHVCLANMMRNPTVWPAMSRAYEEATGTFPARLLAALDAAEAEGGDIRGLQSAAILIVPPDGGEADRLLDLRVDDHPRPLDELRRLVGINDAYVLLGEGDALLTEGDEDASVERYLAAAQVGNAEIRFWAALGLIAAGDGDRGSALLRTTTEDDERWPDVLQRMRLPAMPSKSEALAMLSDAVPEGGPGMGV